MASQNPPYPPEYDEAELEDSLRAIAYTLLRSGTTVTEVHAMVDEAMQKARDDTARELFGS